MWIFGWFSLYWEIVKNWHFKKMQLSDFGSKLIWVKLYFGDGIHWRIFGDIFFWYFPFKRTVVRTVYRKSFAYSIFKNIFVNTKMTGCFTLNIYNQITNVFCNLVHKRSLLAIGHCALLSKQVIIKCEMK